MSINPNKQAITDAIGEIVIHMDRMQIEKEGIADILKELKEKFECKPTLIRKVANAIHKGKVGETRDQSSELTDLIEEVVGISD